MGMMGVRALAITIHLVGTIATVMVLVMTEVIVTITIPPPLFLLIDIITATATVAVTAIAIIAGAGIVHTAVGMETRAEMGMETSGVEAGGQGPRCPTLHPQEHLLHLPK